MVYDGVCEYQIVSNLDIPYQKISKQQEKSTDSFVWLPHQGARKSDQHLARRGQWCSDSVSATGIRTFQKKTTWQGTRTEPANSLVVDGGTFASTERWMPWLWSSKAALTAPGAWLSPKRHGNLGGHCPWSHRHDYSQTASATREQRAEASVSRKSKNNTSSEAAISSADLADQQARHPFFNAHFQRSIKQGTCNNGGT